MDKVQANRVTEKTLRSFLKMMYRMVIGDTPKNTNKLTNEQLFEELSVRSVFNFNAINAQFENFTETDDAKIMYQRLYGAIRHNILNGSILCYSDNPAENLMDFIGSFAIMPEELHGEGNERTVAVEKLMAFADVRTNRDNFTRKVLTGVTLHKLMIDEDLKSFLANRQGGVINQQRRRENQEVETKITHDQLVRGDENNNMDFIDGDWNVETF